MWRCTQFLTFLFIRLCADSAGFGNPIDVFVEIKTDIILLIRRDGMVLKQMSFLALLAFWSQLVTINSNRFH